MLSRNEDAPVWLNAAYELLWVSTHKQLETIVCVISIVATDVLVLKHQAIGIHSVDSVLIVLPKIHT